ncbi:MAG TPA: MFS transporter [Gaiellaceae bacterium]|nr:MFS transporter [Gaiellaceae bacterium]
MKLLRDGRIAALLAAEVVSSLGTQMTWVALPWFVLRTTGSPQRMTWVLIAEIVPIAVLGFWGGAIAGRVGTRRTMLLCDLARVPLFAAIPLLNSLGLLPFWMLLALVALSGVFIAPYLGVQRAVVPELVGEEHGDVATATALFQAANRLTIFLGPPLAGVLIAIVGATNILYIDAATYLVSFVLVGLFVHPPEVAAPQDRRGAFDGARFILHDRLLRIWQPSFTLLDVCWTLFFATLPVLVVTRYGANPHVLGWLFGALGGGALLGAFVALHVVRRIEPLALTAGAFLCQMASMWGVVMPGPWLLAAVAIACAGFFMSLVNAPMQAFVMLRIPPDLRTQALAFSAVLICVAAPIGLLLAGWALSRFATRDVIAAVLGLQSLAVLTIVGSALVERSTLQAAPVDSPA